jgi:hypothetical protein
MRHFGPAAVLFAILPVRVMADQEAKVTDEQLACVANATKEYLTTNAQLVLRASPDGAIMSIDDKIGQRRLVEGYCKQYAACLVSSITDSAMKETALRAMFAGCLDDEAKDQ